MSKSFLTTVLKLFDGCAKDKSNVKIADNS